LLAEDIFSFLEMSDKHFYDHKQTGSIFSDRANPRESEKNEKLFDKLTASI